MNLQNSPIFKLIKNIICFSILNNQSTDIDFLSQSVDVLQELDSKKRQIRSLRGFFIYALEIMEAGKDFQILSTNLQPFFWRKVKTIIRQNKKGFDFLFKFDKKT